ncbi:hypothetical protein [Tellurirhabdus bombi]|uniref:hypothetical protein n=1 Tax=Tellurirhabdus bombi TaxID=2907205 RepID=UPI001F435E4D|nr:hypothetical protein [Tellurirhabdus bombi]
MYSFESNAEDVFRDLLRSVERAENGMQDNLRIAAHDALAIIADRVQQSGQGINSRLVTKAVIRSGVYSRQHSKRRSERGRQTNHVDLTLEGDLMRNWDVLSVSPKEAIVGFRDDRSADIAGYQEAYYGQPIFDLSDKEQSQIVDGIAERLIDDLRQ